MELEGFSSLQHCCHHCCDERLGAAASVWRCCSTSATKPTRGPVVLEEASFYYKAPVNKNFSKKGLTSPNFATLHIMREQSRCVHRNTQANQMTRCLEQANHSQLHSLVLCCIKAV
ncbi:uncharacterized protein LOC119276679 isoform X2 [Triticum dicoccoides]|uniref:uncharacterized protein LOC119276679 isoform X2 n=1 Tax=Triticum dicoccoides TaxID=85692 RepID=UPI00188EC36F|nr:uncharacterized protein LOC119276679 isoform X2 [Triticum dicoccoides]XP_044349662.1 uncharacterized protein LOC123070490 isoform X2 [Triticum aestivum]